MHRFSNSNTHKPSNSSMHRLSRTLRVGMEVVASMVVAVTNQNIRL